MTEVTSNGIVKWTNSDPSSLVQESQAQGDSIELALAKRERYDFVWANSAERTAQTGMVQGSRGYQVDTKSEYLFDNSNWRLALPHAEFTATKGSFPSAALTTLGNFSVVPSYSTDTTFCVPNGDGIIRLAAAGMYAATITCFLAVNTTNTTLLDIATTLNDDGLIVRQAVPGSVTRISATIPNFWVATTNTNLYFKMFQTAAGLNTIDSRVRITRWA